MLLQANHSDVPAGIENLFWRQDTTAAALFAAGCADGRARGGVGEQASRQALAFRQPALHAFGKRVALPANLDLGRCRAQRKDGKNEKQQ